jgi:hypothetical protein
VCVFFIGVVFFFVFFGGGELGLIWREWAGGIAAVIAGFPPQDSFLTIIFSKCGTSQSGSVL